MRPVLENAAKRLGVEIDLSSQVAIIEQHGENWRAHLRDYAGVGLNGFHIFFVRSGDYSHLARPA